MKKFGNKLWFTNLDIKKRHEKLILWKPYNPGEYNRLPKDEWEVVRQGFREEDTVFVIPTAGTALRKLLHDHSDGYK